MQHNNRHEIFRNLILAFGKVPDVIVVDSVFGSLSLHWGLKLTDSVCFKFSTTEVCTVQNFSEHHKATETSGFLLALL
jgi:hypothetical protein